MVTICNEIRFAKSELVPFHCMVSLLCGFIMGLPCLATERTSGRYVVGLRGHKGDGLLIALHLAIRYPYTLRRDQAFPLHAPDPSNHFQYFISTIMAPSSLVEGSSFCLCLLFTTFTFPRVSFLLLLLLNKSCHVAQFAYLSFKCLIPHPSQRVVNIPVPMSKYTLLLTGVPWAV